MFKTFSFAFASLLAAGFAVAAPMEGIPPLERPSIDLAEELQKIPTQLPKVVSTRPAKVGAMQHCGPGNGGMGAFMGKVASKVALNFGGVKTFTGAMVDAAKAQVAGEVVGGMLEAPAEERVVCVNVVLEDKSIHKTTVPVTQYNQLRLRVGRQIEVMVSDDEIIHIDWK